MSLPSASTALPAGSCPRCRELTEAWWRRGVAGDWQTQRHLELEVHEHLVVHPDVVPPALPGCQSCAEVMALAGPEPMATASGPVCPARLHRVHHLMQHTTG